MSGAEHLGPYLLGVKEGVFPLGGDSLALGAFATVKRGWRVCDLGTGSGCLLLMLAAREGGLSLTGVEREERAAQCARENLAHSGLEGTVLQADWRQVTLPAGGFDLVISNPPYFQPGHGGDGGGARQADCSLEKLCRTAARLLRNRGRFALCHRPERLAEVLDVLRAHRLEPKRLAFVKNRAESAPWLFLVEAQKNRKTGLKIEPDILIAAGAAMYGKH